ncbi:MAG: hypothetical protein KDD89_02090 [Anaerolineales bacterium]|nr:hypothetical protein [Anaerolineales bacterium]
MKQTKEVAPIYLLSFGQPGERWCVALKTAVETHYFVSLEELMLFLAQHIPPPTSHPPSYSPPT